MFGYRAVRIGSIDLIDQFRVHPTRYAAHGAGGRNRQLKNIYNFPLSFYCLSLLYIDVRGHVNSIHESNHLLSVYLS